MIATLTALLTIGSVIAVWRHSSGGGRVALAAMGALVCLQYVVGVTTLLLMVPVGLATIHQSVAILLLSAALVTLYLHRGRLRRYRLCNGHPTASGREKPLTIELHGALARWSSANS